MKCIQDPRCLLLFLCGISAALLASTFVVEYGFNIPPCNLCLLERIPYGLVSLVGIMGLMHPSRIFLWAIFLVFIGSILLSAYHLAVVYHWLDTPSLCTKPFFGSMEELLASDTITPCDNSPFNVMGLPLALWNLLVSLGLGSLCGWALLKHAQKA